jgi:nucleotide-binding universal stress UspA family protein
VIPFPPRRVLVANDQSARARAAKAFAEELGGRFDAAVESVTVEDGDPAAGILAAARRSGAELIVMATEGRRGLSRWTKASVAEAVIRDSPVPVLVLHGRAAWPDSVLAPINLRAYAEKGLLAAARVAAALGAELTMLHVRGGSSPASMKGLERAMAAVRKRFPLSVFVDGGEPVQAILGHARAHGLVVLVEHGAGGLGEALLGTTAERVARESGAPVLILPAFRPAPSAASSRARARPAPARLAAR